MKKVFIFAGTTEGRILAETLVEQGIACHVSVATEYGKQVMQEHPLLEIKKGRLDVAGMEQALLADEFAAVVDATHPYAVEVSKNIAESCAFCKLPYLRLQRDTSEGAQGTERFVFTDAAECAAFLEKQSGNVLLTTGSKDLAVFCREESLKARLFARVLPGIESIQICERLQLPGKQIIAMQGPFSEELNSALLKQYQISWMVTKESGSTGGVPEKIAAAGKCGVAVCVIGNPEQSEGLRFEAVCDKLSELLGTTISCRKKIHISLIGMGMGTEGNMTVDAAEAYKTADCVFGAKRLLEVGNKTKTYPYYLSKDILPCLEELLNNEIGYQAEYKVAILFSGDSGFYSGCEKLYQELQIWAGKQAAEITMKIYPGISSVSYLAAKASVSWQNAAILSTHGKAEWEENLIRCVESHEKTFALTSGLEDVKKIAELLKRTFGRNSALQTVLGYRLSYPDEQVWRLSLEECAELEQAGIYTCLILNSDAGNQLKRDFITHGLADETFLRDAVPMTKEEVREVVISKLRLTPGAVVYDIGSGSGSVAIEIARCSEQIFVHAVEHKELAVELIRKNQEKFGVRNLSVVQGHAPEVLEQLPMPTHVFIGGSDGCLAQIVETLQNKKVTVEGAIRVVMTAVSLETVAEAMELLKNQHLAKVEMVQMQVSRSKEIGRYHMMQAENPIYIISFEL